MANKQKQPVPTIEYSQVPLYGPKGVFPLGEGTIRTFSGVITNYRVAHLDELLALGFSREAPKEAQPEEPEAPQVDPPKAVPPAKPSKGESR